MSTQAEAALKAKYPAATNVVWQTKQGYVVADFSLAEARAAGAAELSAWFDNGGAWYMTETDIPFAALPEAVQTAFNGSEYAAAPWQVDDVDKLEREGVETIYVVEVEKRENGNKTEVDLYYAPDGVLVKKIADAAPRLRLRGLHPLETGHGHRGVYPSELPERPHHGDRPRERHDRGGYRGRPHAARAAVRRQRLVALHQDRGTPPRRFRSR